jgi:hypothetical protein
MHQVNALTNAKEVGMELLVRGSRYAGRGERRRAALRGRSNCSRPCALVAQERPSSTLPVSVFTPIINLHSRMVNS